jgi:ribonuclease BN (tRNA processing enzyme)
VEDYVRRLLALAYPEVAERPWPRPITFVEAQDGDTQTVDGLTFTAIRVEHVPQVLDSFGYRVQFSDGVLAYSGDAALTEALWTLLDRAQVCVLEAASQEHSAVHLGLQAMRAIVARVPAGTAILLNHLDVPDAEPWRDLPVIVPEDLATYQVP